MIKVIAQSKIKEGSLQKVFVLYALLIEKTRQEIGCISYELYQEIGNKNNLTFIEEWESLKYLKKHTKTKHFIEIVEELAEYETELPVLIYKKLL